MRRSPPCAVAGALATAVVCGCCFAAVLADEPAEPESTRDAAAEPDDAHTTESLRGRVVWLSDALERHYGVRTTEDAKERVLVLETEEGELIPLIEDRRGRSFRSDQRLRDRDVELLVQRYRGAPLVQVIRVYAVKPDGKYVLDYWCDICAISMIELGPCDCCQGTIELRERKVE